MNFQKLLPLLALVAGCTYTLKIEDGRTAHERRQYHVAIPMLEKEYARAKTRAEKGQTAYLLADSHRRTGHDEQALAWFKIAADNNYGPDALKGYAYGLKKLERYGEAAEAFKNLGIEIGSPYEYRKEVNACKIAQDWRKETPTNGWTVEPAAFNSPQNDFSPALFADGRVVFSSDRSVAAGKQAYNWTGNKFMDLFIAEADGASPQAFDNQLNSDGNEGTACFNATFTEVFFVRAVSAYKGDDAYCKIYFSEKTEPDGAWSLPRPMPYQKEKINYLHPALSPDGSLLIFAAADPEGWGGLDLWAMPRSAKNESGWDEPRLLSRAINTPGNEAFPTFDRDTLYFASDGLMGMGGLDIFRTHKLDKSTWAPPLNLKSPVNSGADDFGFAVDGNGQPAPKKDAKPGDLLRAGFFTSNRPGGKGGDDIFRFEQRVPAPPPVAPELPPTEAKPLVFKMLLEGYVLEKIFARADDPNSPMLGRKPLAGAMVQMDFGGKKQKVKVGEDGLFRLDLTENMDYSFAATLDGYLANSTKFSTKGIGKDPANPTQVFEVEIVLEKIYRDREIVLENIYYDYDKWDIRPDAEPTLDRLAETLRQNPSIRIQLGSHTDCRGNDAYNAELSQRRAQSAVNYLISKGIDGERLTAVGYGETSPAAACACAKCTEPEHQANRRTTFKIVD